MRRFIGLLASSVTALFPAAAHAEPVVVFAAGSLRAVVADLASELKLLGIEVKAEFGPSGTLRGRIEMGEKVDLLLSADLASPRKLEAAGLTSLPVIAFARNQMCVASRPEARVTPENLVDRMLDAKLRLKTSTPVADPSGDYAWAMLDRIGAERPGAADVLKRKAQATMDVVPAAPASSMSAYAAVLAENKADISIMYCSGAAVVVKEAPGVVSFPVPSKWEPKPVYGAAVLSNRAEASRAVLYLLSEKGQALISRNGLMPLLAGG